MEYIIMAGGDYTDKFKTPKQLLKVNGEVLIERTIRLLKENGVTDIAISTNTDFYNYLGIDIIRHDNNYIHDNPKTNLTSQGSWLNAYYLTDKPCCYLHGDVYFSENAIKTIVEIPVKDTMFFCIPDKCDGRKNFNIKGREPLAYKVNNNQVFNKAIQQLKAMIDNGLFTKDPISWNVYRKINNLEIDYVGYGNDIFNTNGDYVAIDDYTTDIDAEKDIRRLEKYLKGEFKMVKCEVTEQFTLQRFKELKDIKRKNPNKTLFGELYVGDTFWCEDDLALYLGGENAHNRAFVKTIEVIPEVTQGLLQVKEIIFEEPINEDRTIKELKEATEVTVEKAKEVVKRTRRKKKE